MDYFEHNDAKGRDARIRVAINRAERARMREPFDGTLFMTKREVYARRVAGRLMNEYPSDHEMGAYEWRWRKAIARLIAA